MNGFQIVNTRNRLHVICGIPTGPLSRFLPQCQTLEPFGLLTWDSPLARQRFLSLPPLGPVNHRAVGSAFSVWTGCPHPDWTSGWPSERFIYLTPDSKFSIHLSKNPEGKIFMLGNEFAVMERCGSKQSKTGERGCAARSLLAGMTRN